MRNAAAGLLLAWSGVLGVPLLLLVAVFITHWLTVVVGAGALVIFAIATYPRTKPVR
jgi:hypothetical protein